MIRSLLIFLVVVFASTELSAREVWAFNGGGNWENSDNWISNGFSTLPTGGDTIYINAGDSVTVNDPNVNLVGTAVFIVVEGVLFFKQAGKLYLPAQSLIIIRDGGILHGENGAGANNQISIDGVKVWEASDGPQSNTALYDSNNLPAILPVEFHSLQARSTPDGVSITFETSSETNNSHFVVERSIDGRNFKELGNIAGAGNSNLLIQYHFLDRHASPGTLYYRVRQTDFDGREQTSDIVAVDHHGKELEVLLYPNPAPTGTALSLVWDGFQGQGGQFSVYDLSGRLVHQEQISSNVGGFTFSLSHLSLPPGKYIARLHSELAEEQVPLVICR